MSTTACSFILAPPSGQESAPREEGCIPHSRNECPASKTVGRNRKREGDDESPKDRGGLALGAQSRGVPRASGEGYGGAFLRRIRPRLRAGDLPLRRLWHRALPLRDEVRLGLWLAGVLRPGE